MSGATQNKDGTNKKWIHGRAVEKGKVRFLSVSALEKGDSSKPNGCLRRWHYQYIGGLKEPPSDSMTKGVELHNQIAHYLTTGENNLSSQVLSGKHMLPDPGPDLLVEHDIVPAMPDGKSGIEHAVLRASGIPIVGAIDLIHARGINKGTEEIEHMYDPEGTIEVIDWKTCRTLNHAKSGPELIKSIQMVGYGKYIFEAEPEAKLVRLSHGYFPSQGVPRKTTIRADYTQIDKAWEHSNRVASSIIDAAKETNPDLVEANTQACNAFGKECPAAKVCSAVKNNVMAKFVGQILSSQIIPAGNLTKNMETPPNNGILARIKAKQTTAATTSNLPEPRANRGVLGNVGKVEAKPADDIARMKAEIARLEALEKSSKEESDELPDISAGPELVPPDAPESNPMLASKPATENSFTQAMDAVKSEPVEATVDVVVEKKKRGPKGPRVKKAPEPIPAAPPLDIPELPDNVRERAEEAEAKYQEFAAPKVEEPAPTPEPETGPVNLFVDCSIEGMVTESLWPLIDRLVEMLNTEAKMLDFRAAPELSHGKWKPAIASYLRNTPIPPGNYTLHDSQSDLGIEVVATMRSIVAKSGGVLVKGVK